MTKILGISCFYHDSAAVLINDGEIITAIQEERITRIKNDQNFPSNAIKEICSINKLNLSEIDYFVFYEKPILKFDRILQSYIKTAPFYFKSFLKNMPLWVKDKLFQKSKILKELQKIDNKVKQESIFFSEHHHSHAASSFYTSCYERSLILTLDAVGEWATSSISIGNKNKIQILEEMHFPNSVGMLYSAFTYYCGFSVNEGEYKLMGLAPYGKPIYVDIIKEKLIEIYEDGSCKINIEYFDYITGFRMVNEKFFQIFKKKNRERDDPIDKFYMDIAASIQFVLEEIVIKICKYSKQKYNINNLCLAGGVALNCVANGKIFSENIFENIWIQPASGDSGGCIGAALAFWYDHLNNERKISQNKRDYMKGSLLGPSYETSKIEKFLEENNIQYQKLEYNKMAETISDYLSKQKIIGLFTNKMEFGPRALGSRSIIADPRSEKMQRELNLRTKFRESFRPFAPAILKEYYNQWFEGNYESPYMLFVSKIKKEKMIKQKINSGTLEIINNKRSEIPAVTHVDFSARIQTVDKINNPFFYQIIDKFREKTGIPLVVNTSFNLKDEPIVCSPEDAYKCFMTNNIDYLVLENFLISK